MDWQEEIARGLLRKEQEFKAFVDGRCESWYY